jgi:hypothetical protein
VGVGLETAPPSCRLKPGRNDPRIKASSCSSRSGRPADPPRRSVRCRPSSAHLCQKSTVLDDHQNDEPATPVAALGRATPGELRCS